MKKNKSSLFLMELIVAILFFALASSVCSELFVKAHLKDQNASLISFASREASNIAEIINSEHYLNEYYKVKDQNVYFDNNYQNTTETTNTYISVNKEDKDINITVIHGEDIIYTIKLLDNNNKDIVRY